MYPYAQQEGKSLIDLRLMKNCNYLHTLLYCSAPRYCRRYYKVIYANPYMVT